MPHDVTRKEPIPPYIMDRYTEFRDARYLPELRRDIEALVTIALDKGSHIPNPILFLLATLAVLARQKVARSNASNEFGDSQRVSFTAEAAGFSRYSHALPGIEPHKAVAISAKALAFVHRAAKGLDTAAKRFIKIFEKHKSNLPTSIVGTLEEDRRALRRIVERIQYHTRSGILRTDTKIRRVGDPTHIALKWWCFLHPQRGG
jgi:hypothetical protein